MKIFTVYVCENQPVMVEGLRRILQGSPDLRLERHALDLEFAISEIQTMDLDVFLLGQPFTARSVLPMFSRVRDAGLTAPTVLWAGEVSEMDAFRALQMGARGIVRKTQPPAALLESLRTVIGGSVYLDSALRSPLAAVPRRTGVLRLTRREREVVEFVCRGMKNKDIAEALSITPGTVKVHLMHIFEKSGVKDRFQLALQGRQFLEMAEAEEILRRTAQA